ncbi:MULTISPECIES: hypothetical protein [Corynebacterium]|uniref:hypothetical protein n=1 Tax=Corynebacterium TaxID=1716 RepID=UPI000ACDB24C|nr:MULTISPECIES: hypothetical protein [Corynebacterium]WJY73062.1 hypothetical protein CAURIC_07215 [Corynebacterium auriscanis]
MNILTPRFKRATTSVALAGLIVTVTSGAAQADVVDRALTALPKGQISCAQATKYWTNTADYNRKVAQARALAAVDPRGPQILAALARVDEAANRCGLKGGVRPTTPVNPSNKPAPRPAHNQPGRPVHNQQARPAAKKPTAKKPSKKPAKRVYEIVPGAPVAQTIHVPNLGDVKVPNLWEMVRNWLKGFGIRI